MVEAGVLTRQERLEMTTQMSKVIQHLRSAWRLPKGADLTDGHLLECFVSRRETAALEALVRRHGSMVWGVCRRILGNHHDAEDALQATFLVLVRKAASVRPREMVGNWLYGVARQTALKARATAAKLRTRERQVVDMPDPAVNEQDLAGDLQTLLDQELSRLPDKYRVAIVLCDLEGETRKRAARQLGLPEGTLAGRLTRGRAMLAQRLARHGLAVTGGTLAALLSQKAASACVPASALSSTIKAVTLVAAGKTAATGLVSANVATLTDGVLKAMLLNKLKIVVTVVFVALGMVVFGGGLYLHQAEAQQGPAAKSPAAGATDKKKVKAPQKQEQKRDKKGFTAWGKEVGGLQAGLGYHPGQKRVYSHGETVKLVVRVRNVGKKEVKFRYLRQFFIEKPPAVTDAEGKPVPLLNVTAFGIHIPVEVKMAPGKEIELYESKFELRPASEALLPRGPYRMKQSDRVSILFGTGKFQIQYERVFGKSSSGTITLDPTLSKLATGKLELEIKSEVKPPQKQEQKQEKEGFTAWGKEVGGLQAGLGYDPGQQRAYRHGETVRLVLRVRNVSKKEVEFVCCRQYFMEVAPTMTDGQGKPVRLPSNAYTRKPRPEKVSLAPGKEIELYELKLKLRPASKNGADDNDTESADFARRVFTFYGTGKFQIQYKRLIEKPWAGPKPDPTLSKLATGKLEVEIKAAPPRATSKEANGEKKAKDDKENLQGIWEGEIVALAGRRIKKGSKGVWKVKMRVDGDRLTLRGPYWGKGLGTGPAVDNEFTFKLNKGIKTKEIDLTRKGPQDDAPTVLGVFLFKGDVLHVCLGMAGKDRPKEMKTSAESRSEALLILKRIVKPTWEDLPKGASPEYRVPEPPPPPAKGAGLKIESGPQGMKVQAAGLQGSAPRIAFDDAKGILVLEGTKDVPATLVRSKNGRNEETRATRIIYSMKAGTINAKSASVIRTLKP
jgi:RNA polymerase sigma factor (sigma-70 family)